MDLIMTYINKKATISCDLYDKYDESIYVVKYFYHDYNKECTAIFDHKEEAEKFCNNMTAKE